VSRPLPRRRRVDGDGPRHALADATAGAPADTGTLPVVGPGPVAPAAERPAQARADAAERSDARLLRTTGSLALPTLVSRVTGFGKALAITAVLGIGAVSDSFTIANTLPNIVAELVLGAVLTSIIIPVLVRAEREDTDGGALFTRKLVTVAGVVLLVATVLAVLAAPLLTRLYLGGDSAADERLATLFAVLLLPQIVFYGFSALFGAVLNTRGVFGLVAWSPVLNNVVTLVTLGVYVLLPGQLEVSLANPQLLVLGVGTTLGIVAQVVVVVPALGRAGVDLRPSWGLDARLRHFGGLAVAVIAYVLVAQVGLVVTNRVANAAAAGAVITVANAWLLLQVPYGILGVSLLTAIMPRMSRAAAAGDSRSVVSDLGLGSRLSTVALLPIIVLFTVHGSTLGTALFAYGRASSAGASGIGSTVAASAFGLLPFAVVLLQLRVFYARQEAWVPTLVMVAMTVVKVPLSYLVPVLFSPEHVALGLSAVSSLSFVVGAGLGGFLLRRALGPLGTGALLRTTGLVLAASLAGVAVDLTFSSVVGLDGLSRALGGPGAVVELAVHTVLVLGVAVAVLLRLRLPELDVLRPALASLGRRLGRGGGPAQPVDPQPPAGAPSGAVPALPYPGHPRGPLQQDGAQRGGGGTVSGDDERPGAIRSAPEQTPPAVVPAPPVAAPPVPAPPVPAPPVAGGPPSSAPRPPVRGPRLVPGAAVAGGRYRLLAEHGGSGELRFWQARDTTLDRDVALTFVDAAQSSPAQDPELEGPQAVLSRTRRLGGITTPGLARVLDVVRGSSGGIVVSEWTPGRSLREVSETEPSPVGAARAVRSLASAAESAHRAGTALAIDHPDRVRISSAGNAVLAFPGVAATADQRNDVRGLGAVLYALTTAHWPLPAPGRSGDDGPVGGLPRAPLGRNGAAVEPRTLRPTVPFEISAVTVRALEPDSGLRTAAAVQTVLDQASVLDQQTDMFPAITEEAPLAAEDARGPRAAGAARRARAGSVEQAPPDGRRGKLTAGLLALGVVVVLVIGGVAYGVSNLLSGGSSDTPLPSLKLDPTGGVISTTAPAATTAPATTPPAAAGPVAVAGATVFSPGGTADHPADVGLAVDGDPATVWPTDQYKQPFPRLKDGVGVLLNLGAASTLSNVSIDSPSAGTVVEIRSSPTADPQLGDTTVLATATLTAGRTEIPVTAAAPVQHVLVWITTLSTVSGKNQSDLAEITLTSGPSR
jgi:putative peptidoglycan lipid II flippase